MARFLFASVDQAGHLDWGGLLDTACCLRAQGHHVLWASGPQLAPFLAASQIELAQVPVAFSPAAFRFWEQQVGTSAAEIGVSRARAAPPLAGLRLLVDMWMPEAQATAAAEALMALIRRSRPDVVVAEPTVLAAALAAEATGTRLAGCAYPGPILDVPCLPEFAPLASDFHARLGRMRRRLGLPAQEWTPEPAVFFTAPDLHLVYTTPEWFERYTARPSPGAEFVGGRAALVADAVDPPVLGRIRSGVPVVLLHRPTNFSTTPEQLGALFDAVEAVGAVALLGGLVELRKAFGSPPDHVHWEPWLPYDRVLARVDAIVHHGGMGTTCFAVRHGVPQVVVPEGYDQQFHAANVAATGAGCALLEGADTAALTGALRTVIETAQYREAARRLQERFAALGGAPRAAELLVRLASR